MKAKSPKTRFETRAVGVILSFLVLVVVCVLALVANAENRKTISVIRLKEDVSSGAVIKEEYIEKYDMYYKEFLNAGVQTLKDGSKRAMIITWDNRDKVINERFASSFLYKGTELKWVMTTPEQSKRHSYLYSMDGELLNIQMDTSDFGEMVVPGDKLNIRAKYMETVFNLPTEEQYMLSDSSTYSEGVAKEKKEMLFNEVTVLDMLNSDGESIFDIYYNFISQSKSTQVKMLSDSNFVESLEPKSILVQATAEEVDRYVDVMGKNPVLVMTLLPRTNGNVILDSLSDIDKLIKTQKK